MSAQIFEDNPFFVLEVAPTDKRAIITSKAEEKAFFLEGNSCDEAQASLLTPSKRLSAEIDWFCECNEATIFNIRQCIKTKKLINIDNLTGIAKLNASLFNFTISSYNDYIELGYAILNIDEQYRIISSFEITKMLNGYNSQAGFLAVSQDDVERELGKKREQIQKIISLKMSDLSEEAYVKLVTVLAEKIIADEHSENRVVIADIIDQYELKMQFAIESASDEIASYLDDIKQICNKGGIETSINNLIHRLNKWDKLVQPLQLKSMASGTTHEESERVGYDVRDLCLWLHNEQNMTETALSLANTAKDIFAEIGSLSEIFNKDVETLNKLINEDKEMSKIISEIEEIKHTLEIWKDPNKRTSHDTLNSCFITQNTVNKLIFKVRNINRKIKEINAPEETVIQLRTILCISARQCVLYAHNEQQQTDLAISIARVLLVEFGDIEELCNKLAEDVSALYNQLNTQSTSFPANQSTQPSNANSSSNGCFTSIVVIAIFVFIVVILIGDSFIDNNPSTSDSGNQSYEESVEIDFSSLAPEGTDVYSDIVSIFPSIGIYTEGSSSYTHFTCECETSSGSTVWVYISISDYREYFDSEASTSIRSSIAEEITFPDAKKIHGEAREADNIVSGLATKIGTSMLIDFKSIDD